MRNLFLRAAFAAVLAACSPAPAQADWLEATSPHFIVYANESPKELQQFAEKLERFDQAVRYFWQMPDPKLSNAGRVTIFVLPDLESIEKLTQSRVIAGFYKIRSDGSYAFVPRTTRIIVQGMAGGTGFFKNDMTPESIFFHEYTHHLQLRESRQALPMWVSEGFAEFFATAEVNKDGSVTIGKFPAYRSWGMHTNNNVPLEQMVGGTYKKLDAEQFDSLYAHAWVLTHYLLMTDSRKGQLGAYVNAVNGGQSALEAAKSAFGDLDQLDKDVEAYFAPHKLLGFTIDADRIPIGNISLRPLSPAESAIMDIRIQSKSGFDVKNAAGIADAARQVESKFPGNPVVETALAETELEAKDYPAAAAAADRALAANSKDLHALILKGRAEMALARGKPKADWDSIQQWFMRANAIDTEDSEPLALFYQSFLEAGWAPTQNAADALMYAVTLAPQNPNARGMAVGWLVGQHRLAEARIMFAPIAYDPHAPETERERYAKIMEALVAGDAEKAGTLMSAPDDDDTANKNGKR